MDIRIWQRQLQVPASRSIQGELYQLKKNRYFGLWVGVHFFSVECQIMQHTGRLLLATAKLQYETECHNMNMKTAM